MRHIIIAVEGIDGAGKTTIIKGLQKDLNAKVVHVFPISNLTGERFRFIGNPVAQAWNNFERFISSCIGYGLSFFRPVILDRCFVSAKVYAASGSALMWFVYRLFRFPELRPDVIIFKNVDAETAADRKKSEFSTDSLNSLYYLYKFVMGRLEDEGEYSLKLKSPEELWYLRAKGSRKEETWNECRRTFKGLQVVRKAQNPEQYCGGSRKPRS